MTPDSRQGKNRGKDTGTSAGSRGKSRKDKYDELQTDLQNLLGSLALAAMVVPPLMADGAVLIAHTEPLSQRLVAVARKHSQFYDLLKGLTTSSIYGALAIEVGTILLAIAANHGVSLPGLPLPGQNPIEQEIAA